MPSIFAICLDQGKSVSREDECGIQKIPILYGTLPVGQPVYGVQPIGDEIFVIRDSTPYIEVYDRNTFQPKRNITVAGMQGPYDMVQSSPNQASLFIADWYNGNNLFRVQLPQGIVSNWSTLEDSFTTLGLARSNSYTGSNIVVTVSVSKKVKKFDVSGNMASEVTVSDIPSPRQSIQVGQNRYAVCHGYGPAPELHRVCLVDGSSGAVDRCYGGTNGSDVGQLDTPGRLEPFKNDCILVADTANQRVVALNQNLEHVRDLISFDIDRPYRLFFDKERDLLFVADNTIDSQGYAVSGKVTVFLL